MTSAADTSRQPPEVHANEPSKLRRFAAAVWPYIWTTAIACGVMPASLACAAGGSVAVLCMAAGSSLTTVREVASAAGGAVAITAVVSAVIVDVPGALRRLWEES